MKKIILLTLLIILSACTSLQEVSKNSKVYHSKGFMDIRNDNQYVTIETENIDKPILLYLQGGPGLTSTPLLTAYFKELERDFIVVQWDQRGAGKSFNGVNLLKYQTIDSYVEDTKELTIQLMRKFNKQKIYVVGNSWGSVLGMKLIQKYPQYYYSFVGTGQIANMKENFRESYDFLLKYAKNNKDKVLENTLKPLNRNYIKITAIGIPSLSLKAYELILRRQEHKLAMTEYKKNMQNFVDKQPKFAYLKNRMKGIAMKGISYNIVTLTFEQLTQFTKLWLEFKEVDLVKDVPKVEVPVYFAKGKNDFRTPPTLAEKYYQILEAPKKEFVWFENSGHCPEFDEYKKFAELMRRVQKETLTN